MAQDNFRLISSSWTDPLPFLTTKKTLTASERFLSSSSLYGMNSIGIIDLIAAMFTTLILIKAVILLLLFVSDKARQRYHKFRVSRYFGVKHIRKHLEAKPDRPLFHPSLKLWRMPSKHEIVTVDYRRPMDILHPRLLDDRFALRVVSWNVELGYKLPQLVKRLAELDADIILIQEADIIDEGHDYPCFSQSTLDELACALNMKGAFAAHHSCMLAAHSSIVSNLTVAPVSDNFGSSGRGVWGCAILSRYELENVHQVVFDDVVKNYGRSALGARIRVPHPSQGWTPLLIYSVHTEVCTGISTRIQQFSEVIERMHTEKLNWTNELRLDPAEDTIQTIIGGDFNTIAQGIARLSPFHCVDSYRFRTIGQSESEFWQKNLFSKPGQLGYGLLDPFSKNGNTILHPLHAAKLDWLLLSNRLEHIRKEIGVSNESDHLYLLLDFVLREKKRSFEL